MQSKSSTPVKHNPWGDDPPEKLNQNYDRPNTMGQQIKDLVNPGSMIDQLLGKRTSSEYGSPVKEYKPKTTYKETLVFSHSVRKEDQTVRHETQELLSQLKRQVTMLEKSEKALTSEISKIKVESLPDKTGIYYLRFFEWLIGIVKQLRLKVDEGRIWLQAFNQRSKKKAGYWKMYKKHGTSFGLSNERTLATQTG